VGRTAISDMGRKSFYRQGGSDNQGLAMAGRLQRVAFLERQVGGNQRLMLADLRRR